MKKFLLILCWGCVISGWVHAEQQPYYFSDELKNAIKNCTPYIEDIYEKNPKMKKRAESFLRRFVDKLDLSSAKMILDVKGMLDGKCHVFIKYDYIKPFAQEYDCLLPQEAQDKLVEAFNETSSEIKTESWKNDSVSMTMTAQGFDLAMTEISNNFCKLVELSEEELAKKDAEAEKNMRKMMLFSDKFKESLRNCEPDIETLELMGMDVNKVEIKGKEKDKCHIVAHGFHLLLNENELTLSGFDELGNLLSDEKKAIYRPSYKYKGILFALGECEQEKSYKDWEETLSIGEIKINQAVKGIYKNNMCQILLSLTMERNGRSEDYSLRCDVDDTNVSVYIKPYLNLLQQYAPKMSQSGTKFSFSGGKYTNKVLIADKELLLKMYKDGRCKKVE